MVRREPVTRRSRRCRGAPADRRRLALRGNPHEVADCRDFTRRALTDWGWLPAVNRAGRERVDDVLLLVSELVTNAVRHSAGPRALTLRRWHDVLRVEVADRNGRLPAPAPPPDPRNPERARHGGYGLRLTQQLAVDWGVASRRHGKSVWFTVRAPRRYEGCEG